MGKLKYTKDQLEQLIMVQLEHIEATGVSVQLVKEQNKLLQQANRKLRNEVDKVKDKMKYYSVPKGKRKPADV